MTQVHYKLSKKQMQELHSQDPELSWAEVIRLMLFGVLNTADLQQSRDALFTANAFEPFSIQFDTWDSDFELFEAVWLGMDWQTFTLHVDDRAKRFLPALIEG